MGVQERGVTHCNLELSVQSTEERNTQIEVLSCLVLFSILRQNILTNSLGEKEFLVAHSSKLQSVIVGKSQWPGSLHMLLWSANREERMCACPFALRSPLPGSHSPRPSHAIVLPTSTNVIKIVRQVCLQDSLIQAVPLGDSSLVRKSVLGWKLVKLTLTPHSPELLHISKDIQIPVL